MAIYFRKTNSFCQVRDWLQSPTLQRVAEGIECINVYFNPWVFFLETRILKRCWLFNLVLLQNAMTLEFDFVLLILIICLVSFRVNKLQKLCWDLMFDSVLEVFKISLHSRNWIGSENGCVSFYETYLLPSFAFSSLPPSCTWSISIVVSFAETISSSVGLLYVADPASQLSTVF